MNNNSFSWKNSFRFNTHKRERKKENRFRPNKTAARCLVLVYCCCRCFFQDLLPFRICLLPYIPFFARGVGVGGGEPKPSPYVETYIAWRRIPFVETEPNRSRQAIMRMFLRKSLTIIDSSVTEAWAGNLETKHQLGSKTSHKNRKFDGTRPFNYSVWPSRITPYFFSLSDLFTCFFS